MMHVRTFGKFLSVIPALIAGKAVPNSPGGGFLVIQTGKLGDIVCSTPVFRAIKEHYPMSTVIVCGDALNKEVIEGNPHVDGYVVGSLKDNRKNFKATKPDVAILLTPSPEVLADLIAARIPRILAPRVVGGYSPFMTRFYRLLLYFVDVVPHRMGYYAPQQYLNMLLPLGIKSDSTSKELFFSTEAEQKARRMLASQASELKVVISPSAGNKIKNWGGENFATVADKIYQRTQADIFVIGTSRDREEVEEMCKHLAATTKVVNMIEQLTIEELKAFIHMTDLFISVDTGPVYIAEAFGVATVDIVGPVDEREQPPRGERHKVVYLKDREAPALHVMNARVYNEAEALRQINGITPEMVLTEVWALLNLSKS